MNWTHGIAVTALAMAGTFAHAGDLKACRWSLDAKLPQAHAKCSELKDLPVTLYLRGGGAKIVSWKKAPQGEHLWLLTYGADGVGTTVPMRMERTVVIDTANKKILGEALLGYRLNGVLVPEESPRWVWTKEGVKVEGLPHGEEPFEYKFPVSK
ncbi:MAG: hypothetical protein JST16_15490 [Bdellovibrionales bacterium]|nr:hypothetical protein [Bdellovibrionales bacterium]